MRRDRWIILSALAFIAAVSLVASGAVDAAPSLLLATPRPTATPHVATPAELARARAEWALSTHARSYNNGQGANTTCARCKSPMNWDPSTSQDESLNCAACKRIPGAPRPELTGGAPVPEGEWKNIGCAVCHEPVGDSYSTAPVFWNQATSEYEPVASVNELCEECHEGSHGFEVIEEQTVSPAHKGWECTRCHGAHGTPAKCVTCHDPTQGKGAAEHAKHRTVNCTACHDAGGLSIWHDTDPNARHSGEYIPVRFAHALRSWPSHNLQTKVDCRRCHHPVKEYAASVVPEVSCTACHADGASLFWCTLFPRNPDPNAPAGSP